jgi:hypothetical protein
MDLDAYIQPVIVFVRDNAAWAPPVVFAFAFGESLAFISLLIPAWGALVAIGALLGSSGIKFWPVWIAASLGAACGDWLSYALAPSRPDPARRALHDEMGHPGHFHRTVFRTATRLSAAGGRDFRDAVLAFSVCQFHLGLRVGRGATHDRRCDFDGGEMDLGLMAPACHSGCGAKAPSRNDRCLSCPAE